MKPEAAIRARILVVEDSPELAEVLSGLLESEGYLVEVTPSGVDALTRISRTDFQIVLLDLGIEVLTGIGVLHALTDLREASPAVIVLSGSLDRWQDEAFRCGATACVKKPFQVEPLLSLIESILAADRPPPAPVGDVRVLGPDDLARVTRMSDQALDALPFGAIRLDRQGVITAFNAFEEEASGYFRPAVRGVRFAQIAPCTQVAEFTDAALAGFSGGELDRVLRFVFPHRGARVVVSVRMYYDVALDQLWLFVSKSHGDTSTAFAGALPS